MRSTPNLLRRLGVLAPMGLAAILALLTLTAPERADACGGFFCSAQAPVTQAGEHILFAVKGDDVEAHIQIEYQGPSEDFSWVLPLPSVPELGVGTEALFTQLRAATDPRFLIDWKNDEGCNYGGCNQSDDLEFAANGGDPSGPTDEGVTILAEGAVGPYAYKVVESKEPEALFAWLNDNGYDQPPEAAPIVGHYVEKGHVFLALKLLKDKDAGDLQPVVLKYSQEWFACVPLILTAIAAEPDMPLYVWVLSEARSVPLNYFHVQLNPKAFDWIKCAGATGGWGWWGNTAECEKAYLDLATEAVDAAAGHAFMTEFAGSTDVMKDTLYKEGQYDTSALSKITEADAYVAALLSGGFPRSPTMQTLIKDHIPKPDEAALPEDCKTDQMFYATWNMKECLTHMPADWSFDPAAMTADLEARIIKPLKDAQALLGAFGYMTRMFSTLSPDEMTKDPIFSFNPDLPDVSNVHTVIGKATCDPESSWKATSVTLTFGDGDSVTYEGDFNDCGSIEYAADGAISGADPAASVQVLRESGGPEFVQGKDLVVKESELDQQYPTLGQSDMVRDPNRNPDGNTGLWGASAPVAATGCAGGSAPMAPVALVLSGLVLAMARRRREANPGTAAE